MEEKARGGRDLMEEFAGFDPAARVRFPPSAAYKKTKPAREPAFRLKGAARVGLTRAWPGPRR